MRPFLMFFSSCQIPPIQLSLHLKEAEWQALELELILMVALLMVAFLKKTNRLG